jgi:hypothetical protein
MVNNLIYFYSFDTHGVLFTFVSVDKKR